MNLIAPIGSCALRHVLTGILNGLTWLLSCNICLLLKWCMQHRGMYLFFAQRVILKVRYKLRVSRSKSGYVKKWSYHHLTVFSGDFLKQILSTSAQIIHADHAHNFPYNLPVIFAVHFVSLFRTYLYQSFEKKLLNACSINMKHAIQFDLTQCRHCSAIGMQSRST